MLRDPAGERIPAHDRLERMADNRVQDDQPMRRDPEREPYAHHATASMVSRRFDQITKEACSKVTPAGNYRRRVRADTKQERS